MPSFEWETDFFTESWLLYPYKTNESSFVIQSKAPNNLDELDEIIKMYGFRYSGKLQFFNPNEDLKENLLEYLCDYFASYCKYKVFFDFDSKLNCLRIRNFYNSELVVKVHFIEEGYWFISSIPSENTFAYDVCETAYFLLKQMDLISIFGQKK
jgi:hypothetical protein